MADPLVVDLPHKLGAEEARRRIAGGIGKIKDYLPTGADVSSAWTGDRMGLNVRAMGQAVAAKIEVLESIVHVELTLPAALSFFTKPIEAALRRKGAEMLEDRSRPREG